MSLNNRIYICFFVLILYAQGAFASGKAVAIAKEDYSSSMLLPFEVFEKGFSSLNMKELGIEFSVDKEGKIIQFKFQKLSDERFIGRSDMPRVNLTVHRLPNGDIDFNFFTDQKYRYVIYFSKKMTNGKKVVVNGTQGLGLDEISPGMELPIKSFVTIRDKDYISWDVTRELKYKTSILDGKYTFQLLDPRASVQLVLRKGRVSSYSLPDSANWFSNLYGVKNWQKIFIFPLIRLFRLLEGSFYWFLFSICLVSLFFHLLFLQAHNVFINQLKIKNKSFVGENYPSIISLFVAIYCLEVLNIVSPQLKDLSSSLVAHEFLVLLGLVLLGGRLLAETWLGGKTDFLKGRAIVLGFIFSFFILLLSPMVSIFIIFSNLVQLFHIMIHSKLSFSNH